MHNNVESYPLTHPQKGIWYIEKFHTDTSIGNIAGRVILEGDIDYSSLERAINIAFQKNDSMRIMIAEVNGEPVQYVSKYTYKKLDYIDFSDKNSESLHDWSNNNTRNKFNLMNSDLFYFCLVKINQKKGGFYIKAHHLVSDAWTMTSVVNQILEYYWNIINNFAISEENKPSYTDYILKEIEYKKSTKYLKDEEFWHSKFNTIPEVASLAYSKKDNRKTESKRKTFEISAEELSKINNFCSQQKISVFIFLLSALAIYVGRVTLKKDITIGTPVLNRSNVKEKNTLGMFVSTVPFRIQIDETLDFANFVQGVSREWRTILRHYSYPYDILLKSLREEHKSIENLYDIVLSYQNAKFNKSTHVTDYDTYWEFNGNQVDSLYIHINDREGLGNIILDYDYIISMFPGEDIEKVHKGFMNLIDDIISRPVKKIYQLDVIDQEEKNRILFDFNKTELSYVENKAVHQLFEEQVDRTPDKIAIVFEDKQLTYKELNEKSNQLARVLRHKDVTEGSIVGIMANRSLEMIIGIIGILKAGGAYLPIDPDYPEERIKFMLEDSGAKVIVAQKDFPQIVAFKGNTINFQDHSIGLEKTENLQNISFGSSPAYIIYTSGSTGKPKGVALNNKGINNVLASASNVVGISEKHIVVSVTTMSFDIFIFETIIPLLKGSKVVIANKDQQRIPEQLRNLVLENDVNVFQTTPSIMQMFINAEKDLNYLKNLDIIILGGEPFPESLLKKLKEITNAKIFNGYGPTETTIYSTFKELTKTNYITIGRPISNTKIYILDNYLNPLPLGRAGEMYIGGAGVGGGYLNREELTKKSFIQNPFIPGEIMYRTGDLALWLENGEIECLGRVDHQVKIRGLRIELGEIENQLMMHKQIKKAVVIDIEDKQEKKYLSAYIVADGNLDKNELRDYLLKHLPNYMIPSYFTEVDSIPLTPNGKIDRAQLPQPAIYSNINEEIQPPRDEIESKLVSIWCKALNLKNISIDDSFFELGGDSLSIIFVISAISKELNINISIEEIYRLETIKKQAEYIKGLEIKELKEIPSAGKREFYPLSSAQKRMYILTQIAKGGTSYNMPGALNIEGKIDMQLLEKVLNQLIERHEALRTYFELVNGTPVQKILEKVDFNIEFIDAERHDTKEVINNFVKPFDLRKAPLMRIQLVRLSEDRHILLFDTHHIISDGMSINILMSELSALYNGENLLPLDKHYKDYTMWQNELVNSGCLEKQEIYWLEQLSGELPVLNLSTDYPAHPLKTKEVGSWRFNVSKSLTEKIKKLANRTGTTLFMVLLSIYNILLSKYSGQEDIIIGTPIMGRNHPDLQNIIGVFVNTLALRNKPKGDMTFEEFLGLIKKCSLEAIENQDYQFDDLVTKLKLKRDVERNPIFDTMFSLRNPDSLDIQMRNLKISPVELGYGTARFPLILEAWDNDDGIGFLFDYCSGTYTSDTIRRMGEHYLNILEEVLEDSFKRIADIEMIGEEDKKRLIHSYNMTSMEYPSDKTVHELFEEQVRKNPKNIALIFENTQISYEELNDKANQIAWILRERGVGPRVVVGIMMNRSIEMIAAMLGVMKSGGAYLPIDIHYPEERINYMLKDSGALILLTQKEILKDTFISNCEIILVDQEEVKRCSTKNLPPTSKSDDPIYVIYTSGSTGKPKGVILTHKSVNNFIHAASAHISFPNKTMLCKTTICFDIFAFETLLPLSKGMKIVLSSERQHNIPRLLNELIIKHNANITITTPSTLKLMAEDQLSTISFMGLTDIVIGGEILDNIFLAKLKELTPAKIFDAYGPTETTVYSTIKELTRTDEINIGKPIGNTQIYILDKDFKLLPEGIIGEIYIGGDGLAEGYLNDEKLTSNRFISSPFLKGDRLYRTGDIGKWLRSGEVEYIGRMDHQVKIRGIRVEMDEIADVLKRYKDIKESLVVDRDEHGRKLLCAYIVPQKDVEISIASLRIYLSKELPDYMMPTYFVVLENMPLNDNGKIDRSQLPEPQRISDREESFKPAEDDIERALISVWSEVINVAKDKLSVNHNFFELGGDSLSIIQVQTKILHFNWGLTIEDFYKYQTVSKLASKIRGLKDIDDIENGNIKRSGVSEEKINILDFKKTSYTSNIAAKSTIDRGVLLTGATGFLGIHILDELISTTNAKIYCLLRKNNSVDENSVDENSVDGKEKLSTLLEYYFPGKYSETEWDRICIINGDITINKLDLSEASYTSLSDNISLVIHSAAIVKHYGNYSEFEKINVIGTQEVIDFCKKYNKSMVYISTCSVAGNHTKSYAGKEVIFTENNFYIGQDFNDNVYVTSKFEAENRVINAMNDGLEATIMRLGNLTGRYSDGCFQINMHENAFYNMLVSIVKLGRISEKFLLEKMELTPVDCCSQAIVKLVFSGEPYGRIFHLFNNNTLILKDVINAFKNNQVDIEIVDKIKFDYYIASVSKDKEKQSALAGLIPGLYFQNHISEKTNIKVSSEITLEYLKNLNFYWPFVDDCYMDKIIKFIKSNWDI